MTISITAKYVVPKGATQDYVGVDGTISALSGFTDWFSGDHIDLSAIDADSKTAGHQDFHFGATAGHTGDIVVHYDAAHSRTVIDL